MSELTRLHLAKGERFGRWMVLERAKNGKYGQTRYLCMCDCGTQRSVAASKLVYGKTHSCGCFQRERASGAPIRHGMSRSAEHSVWRQVKQRCYNPSAEAYVYYGGRGIRVCEAWLHSFETFYDDVGARPSQKHMLIRLDDDGDYEPGNVRWSRQRTQFVSRKGRRQVRASTSRWTWRGKTRPW